MKNNTQLFALSVLVLMLLVGCATPIAAAVSEEKAAGKATSGPAATPTAEGKNRSSCAAPLPQDAARCREMEAEILAATVRLKLRIYRPDKNGGYVYEDSSVGHATIIDGRYLLTHNHFGLSLADFADERRRTVTVYRPDGAIVLKDAPFAAFTVVVAAPETLLLDFGDYGGQGLFATLGMGSVKVDPQWAGQLRPGMEVAQVNWNGRTAHIDWVQVEAIRDKDGTRVLVLDNFAIRGASGGGVFYEGYHLANNWFCGTEKVANGDIFRRYTVAALD